MSTAEEAVSHAHESIDEGSKALGAVSAEVSNFLADIGALLKSKSSLAGIDVDAIKQQISSNYSSARDSIAKTGDQVAARAKQAASSTDEFVREEPWKAVGIGVAVGFLLGVVAARR